MSKQIVKWNGEENLHANCTWTLAANYSYSSPQTNLDLPIQTNDIEY